jgi:hypothetical protein
MKTSKRKQWEREELSTGSVLIWSQHGRYHTVYICSPIVGEAPESCYHGTNSFEAQKAFEENFIADQLDADD